MPDYFRSEANGYDVPLGKMFPPPLLVKLFGLAVPEEAKTHSAASSLLAGRVGFRVRIYLSAAREALVRGDIRKLKRNSYGTGADTCRELEPMHYLPKSHLSRTPFPHSLQASRLTARSRTTTPSRSPRTRI